MKSINQFLRLNENIEIEIKIFSIVILVSLIICSIFTIVSYFFFPLYNLIVITQSLLTVLLIFFSYQIHLKKKYIKIYSDFFLFIVLIVTDIIFFQTDGINGAATLPLTLFSAFGLLLQNTKKRKIFFIALQIFNYLLINAIAKIFPSLVVPYRNSFEREFDFFMTAFIVISSSGFLVKFFKDSYDLDRKQIIESKETLQKLIYELEKSKQTAEQLASVKSNFLANMSHEIRTPLHGIIGMTELYFLSDSEKEKELSVKTIQSSSRILLSIVNNILDFSKMEAEKIILESLSFNLTNCIQELVRLFSVNSKIVTNSVTLSYEIDPSLEPNYIGDEFRLTQVLLNLISNAVKFTDQGFVKIIISLENDYEDSSEILFKVVDSGIGIEDKSILFKLFEQADASITRKFGGTGLGLTISKNLVRLMGGDIKVDSEVGVGSTFYFSVNLKKERIEKDSSISSFSSVKNIPFGTLKILLVEDNALNQLIFSKFMNKLNLNLDVADNGKIAIDKILKQDYDIVFMDMSMPEMDGLEATRIIRNLDLKRQPIIISLTANVGDEIQEKCYSVGINDFLTKPYSLAQIRDVLEKNSKPN